MTVTSEHENEDFQVKILITNTMMSNSGDAAILLALVNILRNIFGKNTNIVIFDGQPDIARRYYPNLIFWKQVYWGIREHKDIKYFKPMWQYLSMLSFRIGARFWNTRLRFISKLFLNEKFLQYLNEYGSADMVITTGGTYLVENYLLEPRIFDYKVSLSMGIPLIFFTQSLGPFSIRSNRKSLKRIFEKSALILLRDKKSHDNILELGVNNANIHISADAAFALADASAIEATMNLGTTPFPIQKIAISVRDWKYFKTISPDIGQKKYLDAMCALSTHIVEKYNAEITYISTCQGIPEYRYDDSKVALQVYEMLPSTISDSIIVDKKHYSPTDLMSELKKYDIVISTRLHMAILALGVGIPVFPIAYEFKTQELFTNLGLGRWIQDIEDICAELLISLVDSFIDSIPKIRNELFHAVERERKSALMSGNMIKKAYEQWQNNYTCSM